MNIAKNGHHLSGLGVHSSSPRISWTSSAIDESICDWKQSQYGNAVLRETGPPAHLVVQSAESSLVAWPSTPPHEPQEPLRPLFFRKAFVLPSASGSVYRARLYITALGSIGLFDVDSLITTKGDNVLCIEVAEGRYIYGDRIAVMEVGGFAAERFQIVSDESWKCHPSPILSSEIYNGQIYDARAEVGDWNKHGPLYIDADWETVSVLAFARERLYAPNAPPAPITDQLTPKRLFTTPSGRKIVDFGQNMVGKLLIHSMTLPVNASDLHPRRGVGRWELGTRPLRGAQSVDTIISSGRPLIDWSPRYTFHGFQFVQVEGWDPEKEQSWQTNIRALVIHTDFKRTGRMGGNFLSIPTDCPQRDECLGWTGDQVFGPSATFLCDCIGMLSEWLEDVVCEQLEHYALPRGRSPMFWTTCGHPFPRLCVLWQLGDWLDPQAPPDQHGDGGASGALVADAYLVHVTSRMADIASVLESKTESTHYSCKAQRLCALFQDRYITHSGLIVGDSQTASSLAIVFGALSTKHQLDTARRQLAARVRKAKLRVATGFAGTPIILRALTDNDNLSLAYRTLLEDRCPSWLYPITTGATTIGNTGTLAPRDFGQLHRAANCRARVASVDHLSRYW
ncbi:uncharacterized protein P174DRAFT_463418 [Aspergillus novofumigatus IBT 16806]|uniref:alpha-L-rhamnosidase n=1 Tax=Aspergillus novofumigatus (strain IBT 16806) TaxID=1392255 RepID=A0A2I1C101_ASPN1|nr:uncharacterized protein P174DRAFT_463418 [Aspergillus novofumigatus IBT 16806]PKX91314.1 hypothetical protein P174DRAFT_463418 [Aspergillus novofumigatus IBT 16806]